MCSPWSWVAAEGAREVVSGTGELALRATAALDPGGADWVVVPGASGPIGTHGTNGTDELDEAHEASPSIPVLLARTIETPLPG